jgi:A/G-specific adenine glycosylase
VKRSRTIARAAAAAKIKALTAQWLKWFARNARDLPWRHTRDPYAIWVSEVMLQQTQVKTVIPYWERWMRNLPNLRRLARASPSQIHKLWEGLGYYSRVRNLHQAARRLLEQQDGQFPATFAAINALPGVGRYTAGAICSIAFNQPCPVVDGNVARIFSRVFGLRREIKSQAVQDRLWALAQALVQRAALEKPVPPAAMAPAARAATGNCSCLNQALMEFGAVICTPRHPRCDTCCVSRHCVALARGWVDELPRRAPPPKILHGRLAVFVASWRTRYLVRQRPASGQNAHLWEFPTVALADTQRPTRCQVERCLGAPVRSLCKWGQVRHTITRHRLTLEVWRAELASPPASHRRGDKWITPAQARRLPFSAAHKKILGGQMSNAKT